MKQRGKNVEFRKMIYKEYETTEIGRKELADKYCISIASVANYIKEGRELQKQKEQEN